MDTIKHFNLNELATFVAVADAGSFSSAAIAMGIKKAAVSKQIARLEADLNTRLLHRSTRRLSLTEVGQEVYWRASRIVEEAGEIAMTVAGRQLKPVGALRVSTSTVFGNLHLAGLLPEFMDRYPEVQVLVNLNDRYVDLVEEGLDVVLRLTSQLNLQTAVARPIAALRYVLVACPAYLERHGTPDSLEALPTHRCMALRSSGASLTWEFVRDGKPLAVKVPCALTVNSSESLHAAMLSGGGIAILPSFVVGPDLRDGRAVRLLPDYTPAALFGSHLYAVYLENRFLAPKVRVFIDYLIEKIGENPYWDDY